MITASVALGIAVDGTLHLLTWFRKGIQEGLTRNQAIEKALMHCGPAMWQTSAAVGIGLIMLAFADLLLVHRFGWLMAALIGAENAQRHGEVLRGGACGDDIRRELEPIGFEHVERASLHGAPVSAILPDRRGSR